jgi:hypothetical protein
MLRRDFCKVSGMSLLALPVLGFHSLGPNRPGPRETGFWVHGSPYLGHSDFKKDFRGLTPDEIHREIIHFRTAEPWRRAVLFRLKSGQ